MKFKKFMLIILGLFLFSTMVSAETALVTFDFYDQNLELVPENRYGAPQSAIIKVFHEGNIVSTLNYKGDPIQIDLETEKSYSVEIDSDEDFLFGEHWIMNLKEDRTTKIGYFPSDLLDKITILVANLPGGVGSAKDHLVPAIVWIVDDDGNKLWEGKAKGVPLLIDRNILPDGPYSFWAEQEGYPPAGTRKTIRTIEEEGPNYVQIFIGMGNSGNVVEAIEDEPETRKTSEVEPVLVNAPIDDTSVNVEKTQEKQPQEINEDKGFFAKFFSWLANLFK